MLFCFRKVKLSSPLSKENDHRETTVSLSSSSKNELEIIYIYVRSACRIYIYIFWMDGWMDGWIDRYLYRCECVFLKQLKLKILIAFISRHANVLGTQHILFQVKHEEICYYFIEREDSRKNGL